MRGTTARATPLAGFHVVITAQRRAADLAEQLCRRGADVLLAPAVGTTTRTQADRDATLQATRALLADPPDTVVLTTAVGLRAWLADARDAGLETPLMDLLRSATLLARGPKARAAIRAASLTESWVAAGETTADVVEHLIDGCAHGRRVAVQLSGRGVEPALERLRHAGAVVVPVHVYATTAAPDRTALDVAVDVVAAGRTDAAVFTSPAGVAGFLDAACARGLLTEVLARLSGPVLPAAIGPVTAEPLTAAGLNPLLPARYRLPILVHTLTEALTTDHCRQVPTPAGPLHLHGAQVRLDGEPLAVSPVPLALLRVLARHHGAACSRADLLAAMPAAAEEHAVEVAVARLRSAIGVPGMVETVVGQGYRLAAAAPRSGSLPDTGAHALG